MNHMKKIKSDKIDISRYLWDYRMTAEDFYKILSGHKHIGKLDRDWAMTRLLNYATYEEIIRLIGYKDIITEWPRLKEKVRSEQRKRGFDYLSKWLPEHHPELLSDS